MVHHLVNPKLIFCDCRRTDAMNLLESAGFSRSNPYYIVKQGKVSFLLSCRNYFLHTKMFKIREIRV